MLGNTGKALLFVSLQRFDLDLCIVEPIIGSTIDADY